MLADELPDEFLRRAASTEHLFLAPHYRAKQAQSLIIVLFDSGPLQLGSCRLVHIAMLILLARRAEQVGARLRWGVLQHSTELYEFSSPEHLQQLLKTRTYYPVNAEHICQWQLKLQDYHDSMGERWLVGGDASIDLWPGKEISHRVIVQPTQDSETLEVQLRDGSHCRRITLPLPATNIARQLIRGQFQVMVSHQSNQNHRLSLMFPPIISSHGSCVGVTLLDEPGVVLFKVPRLNDSNIVKQASKPVRQHMPSGWQILAMHCQGKMAGALLSQGDTLTFWQTNKLSSFQKPEHRDFQTTVARANLQPSAYLTDGQSAAMYVLDRGHQLVLFSSSADSMRLIMTGVLGIARMGDNALAYICYRNNVLHQVVTDLRNVSHYYSLGYTAPENTSVMFAFQRRHHLGYPCAIQMKSDTSEVWRIHNLSINDLTVDVSLPEGWKAIGLYYSSVTPDKDAIANLLLINLNKRSIGRYFDGQLEKLYTTPTSKIVRKTFCPVSGLLALLTEAKELIVYSVHENTLRLFSQRIGGGNDE
ncbi:hypothetical protein ELQ32_15290 [Limnobaculum zhutongyuii]|uniref:hypothetical protein n=1 Tax=Limnobaculum zhutongyuii TaxID=2498113 RepID=UPI001157E0A8|nr:hypothetical protein [Limnobaculum zhutongyuii]TQS87071.1 hypothetical protein ELQ32_15290 [Limnobaculum zhutongyuii]